MTNRILTKLSIVGALLAAGCMRESAPVYTVPANGVSVVVVRPDPVCVVVSTPTPPRGYHPHSVRYTRPLRGLALHRHAPYHCDRLLPSSPHRCGR